MFSIRWDISLPITALLVMFRTIINFHFCSSKSESAEEAIEEKEIVEEDEKSASSEGEGDDLLNNIEDDYKAVPELD